MKLVKVFIFLLFVLWSKNTFATAQYGDLFVINGKTVEIFSNPLEEYFEKKGARTIGEVDLDVGESCTALWRGYVATWKLENDKLYLIRVQTNYCSSPKEIDIKKEFGSKKVFADWVDRTIVSPQGELLQYVHMGYASIYEGDKHYTFKQGKLIDTKEFNYLEKDSTLLFPGEYFLRDTIQSIILNSLSEAERDSIDANDSNELIVSFNENGEISNIAFLYESVNDKIMLRKAKEALIGFPQIMKVNHKNYYPPELEIWLNGHCLKFPNDTKYGCISESRVKNSNTKETNEEETILTTIYLGVFVTGLIVICTFVFCIYKIKQVKRKRKNK